jgi:hypothetical protein
LLFVGDFVGASVVVSFVFAVGPAFGVRVVAVSSMGVGVGLNESAVGTATIVG